MGSHMVSGLFGQVTKGFVCGNRMINTGPTNNKIYCRCAEMVCNGSPKDP